MPSYPPHILASARMAAGLQTQGALASRSGIDRKTIVRAEKGLSIHESNLEAILTTLRKYGVTIEIVGEEVTIRAKTKVSPEVSEQGDGDVETPPSSSRKRSRQKPAHSANAEAARAAE